MSINSVESPYPIFTDVDGSPLESGYIYIGETSQNPEVVPAAAYWDSSLTTPATQPIRTIGGYPSRAGTAARLYVQGDYSITVRDKNSSLVFTSPSATDILISINSLANISGLIGYTEALDNITVNVLGYHTSNDGGGGAFNWDSTVDKSTGNAGTIIDPSVSLANQGTGIGLGCWVRQYSGTVNAKWFGAKGDGVTDDTSAIQSALNYIYPLNATLLFSSGDYVISDLISISGNYTIGIAGEAIENSRLIYTSVNSGISLTITDWKEGNVTLNNITVIGSANGTLINPAIEISYTNKTSISYSLTGPVVRDFTYTNDASRNTIIGDSVLKFDSAAHVLVDKAYITSVLFSGIGIRFTGDSISSEFGNTYVHNSNIGISVEGGSEGGEFISCNIVGNNNGVIYNTTIGEPGGSVIGCHFNNREKNVMATNRVQLVVSGGLFYRQAGGPVGFADIVAGSGCSDFTITDNIMITDPVADGTAIGIDLQTGNVHTVHGNHIRQRDTGIKVGAAIGNSIISNNNTKTLTKPIDNLGGLSNRIRCGELLGAFATTKLSTQSIVTSGVAQNLVWNAITTTNDNRDDEYWNVSNPTRITAPEGASTISIAANVIFDINGTGYRKAVILKNGAVFAGLASSTITPSASESAELNLKTGNISVVSGDYFELEVTQTSGGALNVLTGNRTSFNVNIIE